MMPSALAVGAGGEFRSPMALAVIGGLLFSTVLSLVFVPAMFMVMDDISSLIWRFGKLLIANTGDAEHAEDHHKASPASSARPPPPAIAPAAE
ncbi:efflux RND transporter permease subunit, partial [Bradyrhizobium sp.]|uniref:efflux RND transporter permease subunit n=1 Tax=Bradyrhizobium sp. TaxID=376 RepID=UPI003BB1E9EA